MFYTWTRAAELSKKVRRTPFEGVSPELRGWNWSQSPVAPLYDVQLPVSDIAPGYCPTGRNVYLKYVAHARQRPNPILERGTLVHAARSHAIAAAKETVRVRPPSGQEFLREMEEKAARDVERLLSRLRATPPEEARWIPEKVWSMASITYAAEYEHATARSRHLDTPTLEALVAPEQPEFPVDGTPLGLTPTLRVDSLLPSGIIIEVKTRPPRYDHLLAIAGYAMALESMFGTPYDYAVLLHVHLDERRRTLKVYEHVEGLGDQLRSDFLRRRDELHRVVAEEDDPGLPDECSPACPYLHACRPERVAEKP